MNVYSKGMDGYVQVRIDPVERPRGTRNSLELELQAIVKHLGWTKLWKSGACFLQLGITFVLKININYYEM